MTLHDAAFFLEVFIMSKRSVRFLSVVLSSLLLGSNVCTFAGKSGNTRKSSGFGWKEYALGAACLVTLEEVVRRRVFNGGEKGKSGKKMISPAPEKSDGASDADRLQSLIECCKERCKHELECNRNRGDSAPKPKTAEDNLGIIYKFVGAEKFVENKDKKCLSIRVAVPAKDYKCELLCGDDSAPEFVHFELSFNPFYSSYRFVAKGGILGDGQEETSMIGKLDNHTLCRHVRDDELIADQDIHFAYRIAERIACKRLGEEDGDFNGVHSNQCWKEIYYLTPLIFERMCELRADEESK